MSVTERLRMYGFWALDALRGQPVRKYYRDARDACCLFLRISFCDGVSDLRAPSIGTIRKVAQGLIGGHRQIDLFAIDSRANNCHCAPEY